MGSSPFSCHAHLHKLHQFLCGDLETSSDGLFLLQLTVQCSQTPLLVNGVLGMREEEEEEEEKE